MAVWSEGESGSELAGEGPGNDGARRINGAEGFEQAGTGVGDVDVAVGAIGEIESLILRRTVFSKKIVRAEAELTRLSG